MRRWITVCGAALAAAVMGTTVSAQKITDMGTGRGGSPHVRAEWMVDGANIAIEYGRPADDDPAAALERAEIRRRVGSAIERLPAVDREVLVLKEFEGLKYREIADLLDVPVGTVMSRLYAARRRLTDVLEETR